MVALLVILTILIFLTVDLFLQRAEMRRRSGVEARSPVHLRSSADSRFPDGEYWLDETHCWVSPQADGSLRVGADWLPTAALGHPQSIRSVAAGTRVRRGDPVVTLRSDERELALASPVDGTVLSVNEEARQEPRLPEHDPFGRGWLFRIRPALRFKANAMRTGEQAVTWMQSELNRLRAFVLNALPADDPVGMTLQDGGLPVRGVARLLDEKDWNRLVDGFFVPAGLEKSSRPGAAPLSEDETVSSGVFR